MNAARRKLIGELAVCMREAIEALTDITTAEQDAFDNMPEGLKSSPNGELMEEAIQTLESASNGLEQAADELESLCEA